MSNATLSSKLFIRIAPTIMLTIVAIGGFAFYSADNEISQVYDAQLISNANVLWTLVSDELGEDENSAPKKVDDIDLSVGNQLTLNDSADDYADSRMFRVWKSGKMMMYSDTALPKTIPQQITGFSTLEYNNETWRIYTLPIPDTSISIEVGEKRELRDTLVANILFNLAVPLLLLVPMIGVMIWFGIGNGLGAIRNLVGQILSRNPDDLSPVETIGLPKDLAPLGNSLNQLLTKLEHSFTAEKRFTDHAAHQLRTPQATIKLQLQMLTQAKTMPEKDAITKELIVSNDRATKLINMLLISARMGHQPITLQPVAAYPSTASVMAELGLLAKEKSIEMSLAGREDAYVIADETLLKLMMSNLVENAIKYTPSHGSVSVTIESHTNACTLSILDTGCGIPEEEREMVFSRFYRISTPAAEGSGLGLAIVAEIIERFSGRIALKTPPSGMGLLVEVTLPAK